MTPTVADRTPAPRPRFSRQRQRQRQRLGRRGLVPAAVLAGSLGASSFAGASTPKEVVTSTQIAGLGTVLESAHRPLYAFVKDPKGQSTCTGGCATIWPPLIVSTGTAHHLGRVPGLKAIHRANGKLQVAIHGHALYFFEGDHSPSHAGGQGVANSFFTVHPNGTLDHSASSATVPAVPAPSQPASSPTSSTTTTRPASANTGPAPTSPAPASPPVTSPPPTAPPTTTTTVPPTTTTTTAPSGGGVGF